MHVAFDWATLAHARLTIPEHLFVINGFTILVRTLTHASFTVPELRLIWMVGWVATLWMRCTSASTIIRVPILIFVASPALLAPALTSFEAPLLIYGAAAWVKTVALTVSLNPNMIWTALLGQTFARAVSEVKPFAMATLCNSTSFNQSQKVVRICCHCVRLGE
jgi:hypothetical protein